MASAHGGAGRIASLCDNVRRQLILDKGQPVAQRQLALFQALNLKLVAGTDGGQGVDGGVEIAMLLSQAFEFGFERIAFLI